MRGPWLGHGRRVHRTWPLGLWLWIFEKALEELRKRWSCPHRFDGVDVSDDEAVSRWAKEILAGGPPDLLINNAAVMNTLLRRSGKCRGRNLIGSLPSTSAASRM